MQQRQHLEKMQQQQGTFKSVATSVAPAESPQALLPYRRTKMVAVVWPSNEDGSGCFRLCFLTFVVQEVLWKQ